MDGRIFRDRRDAGAQLAERLARFSIGGRYTNIGLLAMLKAMP
jgi:predicted phosphoribosyltransferase